jgi:hypothetical protein
MEYVEHHLALLEGDVEGLDRAAAFVAAPHA